MASDIQPLTSVSSTPLVREKRHYPGEQKKNQQKKQDKQEKNTSDDVPAEPETDDIELKKGIDIDEKSARVKHIDEYA